ncbi:MAG TPA: hypothetical protein PKH28_04770, partial [Candidatus Competibacteraceae bacterium]|nr:hypothetical protein [Candidatus Competibacteraceae bacterium]
MQQRPPFFRFNAALPHHCWRISLFQNWIAQLHQPQTFQRELPFGAQEKFPQQAQPDQQPVG